VKIRFVIIGAGWRAAYYIRAALALPVFFDKPLVFCRTQEKACRISEEYGIPITVSEKDCLDFKPDFVVTAVSKEAGTQTAIDWIEKGFTVVSETPAAPDFCSFEKLKSLPEDN
jgi:predicted dehydrogenase